VVTARRNPPHGNHKGVLGVGGSIRVLNGGGRRADSPAFAFAPMTQGQTDGQHR